MATITLTWNRNSTGGTPSKYNIYRKTGDHGPAAVKAGPDAGFPISVTNTASDDPGQETFVDTDSAATTGVNALYSSGGTSHSAPASASFYSYTVTAVAANGTESGNAANDPDAKNILA